MFLGDPSSKDYKGPTTVCRNPVRLIARQRLEHSSEIFKYLIECYEPHQGVWREVQADASTLLGQNAMVALMDRGLIIDHMDLFKRFIRESVNMHIANKEPDTFYETFGWKRNRSAFLIGRKLYGAESVETVSGSLSIRDKAQHLGIAPGATLEGWQEVAQPLMVVGQEAQAVAILASFAAPLMAFMSTTDGGAIYSMVTGASGQGKSFALAFAESVWGSDEAMRLTSGSTKASRGVTIGLFANLPVTWEEFSVVDPSLMGEEIRRFTDGRDKARAAGAKGGELAASPALWQTILITTSNTSIVDTLMTQKGDDAQAYRIFETELSMGKADYTKGERMVKQAQRNRGVAGDIYLRALTDPRMVRTLEQRLEHVRDALWEEMKQRGFDRQHRYYIRFLAAVQVAAELVNHLEILEINPVRITGWIKDQMTQELKAEKPLVDPRYDRAIEVLAEYISEVAPATLVVKEAWRPKHSQVHAGNREPLKVLARLELDSMNMVLALTPFFNWMTKHRLNARETLRSLRKQNVYLSDKLLTLTAGTNYPGSQIKTIVIDGRHPSVNMVTNMTLKLVQVEQEEAG